MPTLTITGAPASLIRGECSAAVQIGTVSSTGAPNQHPALALATSGSSLRVHLLQDCSDSHAQTLSVLAGSAKTIYLRGIDLGAGSLQVTDNAVNYASATHGLAVIAGNVAQLGFITAPISVPAGECSGPITVEQRNAFGFPVPSDGGHRISFWVESDGGAAMSPSVWLDPTCTSGVASLQEAVVASDQSTATARVRGQAMGTLTLHALPSGMTPMTISQVEHVDGGLPVRYGTSNGTSFLINECRRVDFALVDGSGNVTTAPYDFDTFARHARPDGGLTLFRGGACDAGVWAHDAARLHPVGTTSLPSAVFSPVDGTYTVGLEALGRDAGAFNLTATSHAQLRFSGSLIPIGACANFPVSRHDDAGTAFTATTDEVVLLSASSSDAGALQFLSNCTAQQVVDRVTIPAGQSMVIAGVRGTRAGPVSYRGAASLPGTRSATGAGNACHLDPGWSASCGSIADCCTDAVPDLQCYGGRCCKPSGAPANQDGECCSGAVDTGYCY